MLEREIDDVIRWFGSRGKLFNMHIRNIKGRKLDFMEAFPDEGGMDMARLPDHVPEIATGCCPGHSTMEAQPLF